MLSQKKSNVGRTKELVYKHNIHGVAIYMQRTVQVSGVAPAGSSIEIAVQIFKVC